jgi:Leucine-rich repeat (LRR) protein
MFYLYVLLFFMCMNLNALAMDTSFHTSSCQQEQSDFVQLPNEMLSEIASRLPQVDVAHVRQTCKTLYSCFVPYKILGEITLNKVQLGDLQLLKDRDGIAYWNKVFDRVAQCIAYMALSRQPLTLDLSGIKVERFMFVNRPECCAVKKLILRSCMITSERENFFRAAMWQKLKHLDLTDNFLGQRDKQIDSGADWDSGADIWPSLASLPSLKVLILRNNKLFTCSPELLKMTGLMLLDVRNNGLTTQQLDNLALCLPSTTILR